MFFNLAFFALVLPFSVLAYAVAPRRLRWVVLLGISYYCFYHTSKKLIVFLVATTLSCYLCGLWLASIMDRRDAALAVKGAKRRIVREEYRRRMRRVVALAVIFNLGLLVTCKYLGFLLSVAQPLLSLAGIGAPVEAPRIGMPLGISFYTFIALSYVIDVYRGTVKPDRNLGRLALFLSFFPQMLEGPIGRYSHTAESLTEGRDITRSNLYQGTLRIFWGIAKKLIVADRLNAFVEMVFDGYASYDGGIIALAAVLYTIQLYCDFSGTIDVAIGIGRIFDVHLPENFSQPFFSRTASEFWQRWHITLGAWFKDYVYYPVSLSAPCKQLTSAARKRFGIHYGPLLASSVALFCVWFGNGLWHGSGSQYIFFGMYYFVLIMLGGLIEPVAVGAAERFGIDRNSLPYRLFQTARTLAIVFVGELIFRANGLGAGLEMLSAIAHDFTLGAFSRWDPYHMHLDIHDRNIVIAMLVVVFVIGYLKEHGLDVSAKIDSQSTLVRWVVLIVLILAIVIFGAYGYDYTPVDPMYAQF